MKLTLGNYINSSDFVKNLCETLNVDNAENIQADMWTVCGISYHCMQYVNGTIYFSGRPDSISPLKFNVIKIEEDYVEVLWGERDICFYRNQEKKSIKYVENKVVPSGPSCFYINGRLSNSIYIENPVRIYEWI